LKNSIHNTLEKEQDKLRDSTNFEIYDEEHNYLVKGKPHSIFYDPKLKMNRLVPTNHKLHQSSDENHNIKMKIKESVNETQKEFYKKLYKKKKLSDSR
jgi:hypothetical protein